MSKSPSSLATLCRALLRELRRRSNSQVNYLNHSSEATKIILRYFRDTHKKPYNAQVWNYVAKEVRTDASSDKRKSEEGKTLLAEYVEYLKSSREHMVN